MMFEALRFLLITRLRLHESVIIGFYGSSNNDKRLNSNVQYVGLKWIICIIYMKKIVW